eukprot:Clim_evm64s156 gene=Clim_evmTU64s156
MSKGSVAIFTSGGDAQGMNAAVRSAALTALSHGVEVYVVREGYQGLVDDIIEPVEWDDYYGVIGKGGTVIGTARCEEFRHRSGRMKAAMHLVNRGINKLVIVGGDGSLTGADIFRQEWSGLLEELHENGLITENQRETFTHLHMCGLVGSIDNDMCGTDLTIGANSALHRIQEAVDAIYSTAASHQRSFVLEVMGRNCGYLALTAAIANGADFVLIPESPPDTEDWAEMMCQQVQKGRASGRRMSLVIMAEGAVDIKGNRIDANMVKAALEDRLGHDTRITILGHVQRGGRPTAVDRMIATEMAFEAVKTVLQSKPGDPACFIGMDNIEMVKRDLKSNVALTKAVNQAMKELDFKKAVELRGPAFKDDLNILVQVNGVSQPGDVDTIHNHLGAQRSSNVNVASTVQFLNADGQEDHKFRVGIICCGAPAAGMNSAIRGAVRMALQEGMEVYGIRDGYSGLADGQIEQMDWKSVEGWVNRGGCDLGTNRDLPKPIMFDIAENISRHGINGLIIIGGFEAYEGALQILRAREQYHPLTIPIVCIPATISNNVPGTEFSLGSDTALNAIMDAGDRIRLSASASRRRVFFVETHGGYCGYLATTGAVVTGAERAYTWEEGVNIRMLLTDLEHCISRFDEGSDCAIYLRNEKCSTAYTIDFMHKLFEAEAAKRFTARYNVLGHLQQGGRPSTLDRERGTKISVKAVQWMKERCLHHYEGFKNQKVKVTCKGEEAAVMAGFIGNGIRFTNLEDCARRTDFKHRIPKDHWWRRYEPMIRMLAKYQALSGKERRSSLAFLE